MKHGLLLVLAVALFSSCISRKKLTYLQSQGETADTLQTLNLQRNEYQVQINDIINVTVKSYDEKISGLFNVTDQSRSNLNGGDLIFYLNGYSVDERGMIYMPVLGEVNVLGNTIPEIKEKIKTQLGEYFIDETVFINVQLAGIRYTVVGDASRPGKYVIYQNQANIFEALSVAGDITLVGDRKEVQIIRQTPSGVVFYDLDLTDKNVVTDPRYFIQPNDIINVKPLPAKSLGLGTTGFGTLVSLVSLVASTLSIIVFIQRIE